MLDHMTFRVTDLKKSRAFYEAALAPLGYSVLAEFSFDEQSMVGLGIKTDEHSKIDTWLIQGPSAYHEPVTRGCHLAWSAPNHKAVDAFYTAALAAGGKDNGAAGARPHYHPHYYGAFVIDPDGNNIEAVCHSAE
jgi:catechol 2,3-dioxygenase-like lactoylglutathione lyase family enzyme